MQVTMFGAFKKPRKMTIEGDTVDQHYPCVVLRIECEGDLTIHLPSAQDMLRLGQLICGEATKLLVADPNYTPTVEEAASHPAEFVAGMTETDHPF